MMWNHLLSSEQFKVSMALIQQMGLKGSFNANLKHGAACDKEMRNARVVCVQGLSIINAYY